jgi:membrane associated rhomboid family serine protease
MVMPLYDQNPFKWPTPPYVTWLLIAINIIIFALESITGELQSERVDHVAGLVPAALVGEVAFIGALPAPLTLITYPFLHGSFWHVFGNMIFLWVFGDDIEEVLGHWRFLAFYFACGIGAGVVFVLSNPGSTAELIGASGAIAGVIAAYLMFRPCATVLVLVFLVPVRVRALWVIGGWAIWQFAEAATRTVDGVAYWAHVGGLATGAVLFWLLRPPGVQLFECIQPQTAGPATRPAVRWPEQKR